jgi:PAS domain S-box-containing protein
VQSLNVPALQHFPLRISSARIPRVIAQENGPAPSSPATGATLGWAGKQYLAALRYAIVMVLLLVAGLAQAQGNPEKPLVVGSEEDYPPFAIGKLDESADGFTVDLWKAVAAEHAINYTIRVRPFRQLLDEFKAGKIDVMINLAQSKERRTFADFSVPHVIVHGAIFVRKGESRIRSESDLAGKSIIVLNADLAQDYAISKGWEKQLVRVETTADGLKLLASGQHDAMLLSKLVGMQTLLKLKISNITALGSKAGFSQKFSFAVQSGNSQLLAKVNEGLAIAKSTGTYDVLYEEWFGVFDVREVTFQQLLKYLGPVLIALLIFAGIFLVRRHEHMKGEVALRRSEAQFRTLAENAPVLIYLTDQNGDCLYVNRRWCETARMTQEEAMGQGWVKALHDDDRAGIGERWKRSAESRGSWSFEYRFDDRAGRVTLVHGTAAPILAAEGKVIGYVRTSVDITASRQATIERDLFDRKVQEMQKLESLSVLAGGIAHDFNNLLTVILGNASVAKMELPPGSSAQECLADINEASLNAAALCKQMLAYSGRGRFMVQTLDLGELVEQTAQMLKISISKKAVLRFLLEKGLPPVEVDATQLQQVIMNLVINASEAVGDTSGVITISTGLTRVDRDYLHSTLMDPDLPMGDYVSLEVSDSGHGMRAETQARIFDPFFTTKFTGRGLGLAAVLGIVHGHQGAMKVYSELGRGSTFKVLFPAATGARKTAQAPPPAIPAWQGKGTVLVVDDEEAMRSTVVRMMRPMGLDPVLAANGRDAVEIFRTNPAQFALVLLDLTMPHMDGEQTFTELRRLRPDVRVVLMSGYSAYESLVRFDGTGPASFLKKPFTIHTLHATIQKVLTEG